MSPTSIKEKQSPLRNKAASSNAISQQTFAPIKSDEFTLNHSQNSESYQNDKEGEIYSKSPKIIKRSNDIQNQI